MSLSNLQAQLSGLNDASGLTNNKNVGSIQPSSKRHDDAVGRGLHHSVQHGHSVFDFHNNAKYKPSILYPDSKAASDVPLATLWENCQDALTELATAVYEPLSDYVAVTKDDLLKRTTTTTTTTTAKKITTTTSLTQLLYILSTIIPLSEYRDNCLHILEYLLRRYNIHIHAADTLLMTLLPHCESIPVAFHRVLQLINIASTNHWMWLRPYSVNNNNKKSNTIPTPPRHVVAKHTMQNTALLHQVLMYTKKVATTINNENNSNLRGMQQILSWSATVLVQGLVHLQSMEVGNNSNKESVLRILLPFVLDACSSSSFSSHNNNNNHDWTMWGHVLASAISETMELSPPVNSVLMSNIAMGAKRRVSVLLQQDNEDEDNEDDDDDDNIEDNNNNSTVDMIVDALTAMLAVGLPNNSDTVERNVWNATMDNWKDCIWLSYSTFEELWVLATTNVKGENNNENLLSRALGVLYRDRELAIDSLLVCFILMTALHAPKHKQSVLKSLLQQPALKPILQNSAKALADWFVAHYYYYHAVASKDKEEEGTDQVGEGESTTTKLSLPLYQLVLTELRRIDARACEEGIAHALQECTKKQHVTALLEGVLGIDPVGDNDGDEKEEESNNKHHWLPPRVALEHADASVRLQAIETLSKENLLNEDAMQVDNDDDVNDAEQLEDSFLRRMASDDNDQVVLAAAEAFYDIFMKQKKDAVLSVTQTRDALVTLYQWSSFSTTTQKKDRHSDIVQTCLQILGRVEAQSQLVLVALTAHLEHPKEEIVRAAGASICQVLGKGVSKTVVEKAKQLLVRHHEFIRELQVESFSSEGASSGNEQTVAALRKRSLWVLLLAMTGSLEKKGTSKEDKIAISQDALGVCMYILSTSDSSLLKNDNRSNSLRQCVSASVRVVSEHTPEKLPQCILHFASTPVEQVYIDLAEGLIDAVSHDLKGANGEAVSVFSVLMESALQEGASVVAIQRLLLFAVSCMKRKKQGAAIYCIVPALALLEHPSEACRLSSIELLTNVSDNLPAKKQLGKWSCLKQFCQEITKNKASASLGGPGFLPSCLASAIRNSENSVQLQECLLTLCTASAVACGKETLPQNEYAADELINGTWLPFGQASGNAGAAAIVLRAMGLSGEAVFPLSTRWNFFGQPILSQLLDTASEVDKVPAGLSSLVNAVVRMLKGVAITDSNSLDNIVISSGPSSTGRRKRSYSLGQADDVTFVDPYPKEMSAALLDILSVAGPEQDALAQSLCTAVVGEVLGNESWAKSVFQSFAVSDRRKIAEHLLSILGESSLVVSTKIFYNLPLDAADVLHLLKECSENMTELVRISIVADFIRSNAKELSETKDAINLISLIFRLLENFSSSGADVNDEVEFVRRSILSAALEMMLLVDSSQIVKLPESQVARWVSLLLALNGSDNDGSVRPFVSQRARSVALSLLTSLCSHSPAPVVASLVPAIVATIESIETLETAENVDDHTRSTFDSIVPVFWKYAPAAGLALADLLNAFVASARSISSEEKRIGLYRSFVGAVSGCSLADKNGGTVGSVIASFLAGEVFGAADSKNFKKDLQRLSDFSLQVLESTNGSVQVSSVLRLLNYVDSLLLMVEGAEGGAPSEESATSFASSVSDLPRPEAILSMAMSGLSAAAKPSKQGKRLKSNTYQQETILRLVEAILLTTNEALLTESIQRFIRKSGRSNAELCLRLWQDLLIVQSTASMKAQKVDDENEFFENAIHMVGESLEHVQILLPLPIFLASAKSLIEDGDTEYLRADAIRLVADRAPEVRPNTAEATLFLEMVTCLVDILKKPSKLSTAKGEKLILLQQSALVAIEHIARAHHSASSEEKPASKQVIATFISALEGCSSLVIKVCGESNKGNTKLNYGSLEDSDCKLLCSVSLCSATLVRVTAPRCLPLLQKFMPQMIACLSSVNERVGTLSETDDESVLSQARMVQVCLLRALAAVTDTLPQFVHSYLKQLLAPSALPSESLRDALGEQNLSIKYAAESLEKSLCEHVPARVLLPVAAKAIAKLQKPKEFEVILRVLKHSIDASSGEELAGHLGSLLKAVTTTYDHDCSNVRDRTTLLETANEAILAMVMKLSEVHLRRLYAILRDWRGALDAEMPEKFALRRHAFWSVSSVLSKELRTIFLPCLGSVLTDAVDELRFLQSKLCVSSKKKSSSEKLDDGRKKRRLSDDDDNKGTTGLDNHVLLSLQPLLLCLEYALRADGQDGGKWIRADDGQRYRTLLEPLGKMLQCKIPEDFPVALETIDDIDSPFQHVVQGDESGSGNVVGCLTALAGAAGNEQLWKPLNYAVLDACGNSSSGRSEIRKAGLACLLSLMKSLGEEYMVLLPECLPILSERLEDNDEEVAGLAQDCIALGEDLLGESLEDSLR